jgi:Fe-Mn family superoxide dismutase
MTPYQAKTFAATEGLTGLSQRQMSEHYKLYEGYIKKANEIYDKLQTADKAASNGVYSDWRALKLGYSFSVNAIKSHELFFGSLGGDGAGQLPTGTFMEELIVKNFGSYENWLADMKATAICARGWVWTAFDWQNMSLFNYLGDQHDAFPIWHATPLVALDTYEHAYLIDYGVNRADYIKAFFDNLNWGMANALAENTGMMQALAGK